MYGRRRLGAAWPGLLGVRDFSRTFAKPVFPELRTRVRPSASAISCTSSGESDWAGGKSSNRFRRSCYASDGAALCCLRWTVSTQICAKRSAAGRRTREERLSGSAMLATPTPRLVLCRGPPASGKSTAFRTLATDPPAGVVFVDHVALKDAHRHLGGAARTEWAAAVAALLSAYISNRPSGAARPRRRGDVARHAGVAAAASRPHCWRRTSSRRAPRCAELRGALAIACSPPASRRGPTRRWPRSVRSKAGSTPTATAAVNSGRA